MEYESSTTINASPEAVWSVLTDAGRYSDWDSGIQRVEGNIRSGERIKFHPEVTPGRAWQVKVNEVEPGRRMTWTGGMPLGLFKGVREFTVEPADGGTRFRMHERFSGPMLPLIKRSMPDLGPSFDRFAAGLKAHSEGSGS